MIEKINNKISQISNELKETVDRYNQLVEQKEAIDAELEKGRSSINFLNGKINALNELLDTELKANEKNQTEE